MEHDVTPSLEKKAVRLKELVRQFPKVAVAFSGGVDSSLLLYIACDTLGVDNVVALQAVSCLSSQRVLTHAENIIEEYPSGKISYRQVELFPLMWKEFVVNNENRCYFCKKRIYTSLKMEMEKGGCHALLDGTNIDDLKDHRPGLRAINELGIHTPLLDAGINKTEIRSLAKSLGLSNHALPSNSCLATRIARDTPITEQHLVMIADAELFLENMGFSGCRVRPMGETVCLEVGAADIEKIAKNSYRIPIVHYFQNLRFEKVVVDLKGR